MDRQELSLRVRKAMDDSDFVLVDSMLSEAIIELDRIHVTWWIRALFLNKEFERCIQKCEEYMDDDSTNWISALFKARSLGAMGRKEDSISEYRKMERLFPNEKEPLVVLIRHHYTLEEWGKALELCTRLLNIDEKNEQGLLFLGRINHRKSEIDLALMSYRNLVKEYPDHLEGYARVGQLLYEKREYEEAKDSLLRALEIDADYRPARRSIGLCLEKLGQSDEAIEWLMIEANREPTDYSNWMKIIDIYLKTSDDDGAKEIVGIAASKIPDDMGSAILEYKLSRGINWKEGMSSALERLEGGFADDFAYHSMMFESVIEDGHISLAKSFLDRMVLAKDPDENFLDTAQKSFDAILHQTETEPEFIDEAMNRGVEIHVSELAVRGIIEKCRSIKARKPHEKRPTIMHVSSSMGRGGAERQLINCIRGTVDSKEFGSVSLCTYVEQGRDSLIGEVREIEIGIEEYGENIDIDKLIKIEDLGSFEGLLRLLPDRFAKDLVQLFSIFKKKRPGIVNSWQDGTNIVTGLAAMMARVPTVIMFGRSMRPDAKTMAHIRNRPYLKMGYRLLLSDRRYSLCLNSERGRESYSEWLEIDKDEMLILHNGLDIERMKLKEGRDEVDGFLEKHNISKDSEIVGGVFRFVREKRLDLWVESAMKTIENRKEVYFIGVGGGPERPRITEMVRDSGFKGQILFPPKTEFVGSWLEIFDLFLLTSTIEGLPNVLIEAQGYGVPVLSTRAGGSEDTFENFEGGVLLLEEGPAEIAEQICLCLDDFSWREQAKRSAVRNSEEKFSIEAMIGNLTRIYMERSDLNLQRWKNSSSLSTRILASMGWS